MSFRDRYNNDNSYSERMLMLDPSTAKSRIFVGNIPTADMTKKDLEDVFGKYGAIIGITLNKGFGFVQYEDDTSAIEAIKQEHGAPYRGKQMDVKPARVLDRAHISRISPMGVGRGAGPAHGNEKPEPPFRGSERERERSPIDRRSREPRDWKGDNRSNYDGYPGKGPNGRDPYYARETGFGGGKDDFRPRRDSGGGVGGGGGSGGNAPVMAGYGNGGPSFGGGMYRGGKDFPVDGPPRGGGGGGGGMGPGGPPPGGPMGPDFRKEYPVPQGPPVQIAEADRANDCEIIVLNKKQRGYAEVIERRLKKLGLGVDLLFPNEDIPIGRVLANISSRGSLYAIVVAPQNEEHSSLTLNILYGMQEEHRNMPLEDAVNLLARNFDAYCQRKPKLGAGEIGPVGRLGMSGGPVPFAAGTERHPDNIQALFTALVEQRPLTVLQYDRVIGYLKEKREVQVRMEIGESKPPMEMQDPMQKPNTQQQVDLQHRILNILNSNRSGAGVSSPGIMGGGVGPVPTPVPAPTGVPPPANWPPSGMASTGGGGGGGQPSGANPGPSPLLSDPTVQKALDSLIQGDLLRKISSSSAAAASTASAVSSAASISAPVVSSSVSSGTMLGNPPSQALFGAYASQGGGRRF